MTMLLGLVAILTTAYVLAGCCCLGGSVDHENVGDTGFPIAGGHDQGQGNN